MAATTVYCTNHPNIETLLRCSRCNRPFCTRCLIRTPVGYKCKECLSNQQAGYYTATLMDYAVAGITSFFVSMLGGAIAVVVGRLFLLLEIFYAPMAGGAISEVVWRASSKRRGRYLWLVACGAFIVGSAMGAMLYPIISTVMLGRGSLLGTLLLAPLGVLVNLGFLIYLALAIGTVYARLR
jgi:hypothetical protein